MTDRADRPIAVGDLVVIVRPRECGCTTAIGRVFRVSGLITDFHHCKNCGHKTWPRKYLLATGFEDHGYSLNRLKRIPPLDELESAKTDEPMKEPA